MKSDLLFKLASILAFITGAMAILAGGPVMLGRDPGYYIIDWLPLYNLLVGLASCFLTAILIWKRSRWALPAVLVTLGSYMLVMLILLVAYRHVVAFPSLVAMTLRISVWLVILALVWFGARVKDKQQLPIKGGSQ